MLLSYWMKGHHVSSCDQFYRNVLFAIILLLCATLNQRHHKIVGGPGVVRKVGAVATRVFHLSRNSANEWLKCCIYHNGTECRRQSSWGSGSAVTTTPGGEGRSLQKKMDFGPKHLGNAFPGLIKTSDLPF